MSQFQWLKMDNFFNLWGGKKPSKYSNFRGEHFSFLNWLPKDVNQTFSFNRKEEVLVLPVLTVRCGQLSFK